MRLSTKQRQIYNLLKEINPKSGNAYLGSLEVLEQEHKDKISQSANSIRHALGLITRDVKIEEQKDKQQEKKGHKKKIRKLVDPLEGLPSELDFQIKLLVDEYQDWFVKVAHYLEFPTERQYRRKFSEMEEVLLKIIRPHFDVIAEIDKILANEKPSTSSFKKLEELIARDLSSYNHFFQNASGDWLPFLVRKRYFDNPKHMIKEGEKFRYGFLSPSRYLARIAEKRQREVLKLILAHKVPIREERNPIILENFVIAASKMYSKYARKIANKISSENWMDVLYFSRLNELISDLMVSLSNDGYHTDAISLARILFDVKLTEPYPQISIFEDYKLIRDVRTIMDNYWYEQIAESKLPILAKNDPLSISSFLVNLINKFTYLENLGRNQKENQEDTSMHWRPAIEDHQQNHHKDYRSVLIDILRNTLESEGRKDIRRLRRHLALISEKKYPIFRRLEIYIYRIFAKDFKREIEQATINYFDRWEFRHEYYHLIKETFPFISKKTKKDFFNMIERGPNKKKVEMWTEYQKIHPDETADLRKNGWKVDKLEPVSSFLEGKIKRDYQELRKEIDIPEHSDFYIWNSGVHASEPKTELEDNLEPDMVINFIKLYKVKKELDFPFHDGTSQKFQEYVEKDPLEFSKRATELQNADSIFAYGLFSSLEKSVRIKKIIDWQSTLSLCRYVVESIKKGNYKQPSGYNILGEIAGLIEEGLKSEVPPPFSFRNEIWGLLLSLIPFGESEDSWEENYPDKNLDAIGISINTTSGKTFHAILQYALWCNTNLKKNNKPEFVSEVRNILENYFSQKIKNSISRHAVLGVQLPNLIYFDKDWTLKNLPGIFERSNLWSKAAWDAYLYNRVSGWVFKEITPYYSDHIKNLKNPKLKEGRLNNMDEKVIEHITSAFAYKISNSEKLFKELLDTNNALVLQHSAWWIGRILKAYSENPNKSLDLEAIRKLWKESKLIYHKEIDWWFTYSPFDKKETINMLFESLKKTDGKIDFLSTIEKELESYAKDYPLKTVECLELIFKSEKNKTHLHAVRGITTKNLLETLLKSKNQKTIDKTKSLIHYLGTLGFNEFRDLL